MSGSARQPKFLLFFGLLLISNAAAPSGSRFTALVPTRSEGPSSPRVAALQGAMKSGDGLAVRKFWEAVAEQGTPLVEPADGGFMVKHDLPLAVDQSPVESPKGSDKYVLVTFLWRSKEVCHVLVMTPFAENPLRMELVRLPDTDVWYRTYRMRNDARFTYELSVNDPDYPFIAGDVTAFPSKAMQADPLNPRHWDSLKPRILSLVELPGAPPLKWSTRAPAVPRGQVVRFSSNLKSAILNNEHPIYRYTPPGYKADGPPYSLLVFPASYINLVPLPVILDNLLAKGLIPPVVAIFIDYPTADQNRETSCYPPYGDFLASELLPWVRQRANVTSDPAKVILGGASASGLSAACVALQHPEAFGNVLSQSGAFWRSLEKDAEEEWLTRQIVAKPRATVSFYLTAGLLEGGGAWNDGSISLLLANRHLRDVLQAKGYSVHYEEVDGGHDPFNWELGLPDALISLLGSKK